MNLKKTCGNTEGHNLVLVAIIKLIGKFKGLIFKNPIFKKGM
jgi:hypothetical protein